MSFIASKCGFKPIKKLNAQRVYQIMEEMFAGTLSNNTIKEEELIWLIRCLREIIFEQPPLLELDPPINICGDIHGQFEDLKRLFEKGGWPPEKNYLFLGDYVDRGPQSIETMCFLLCLKFFHPENVFLLRGNHESEVVNKIYGFQEECKQRYSMRLFKEFVSMFDVMPLAAVIGDKIFCCHGGISPDLRDLRDIQLISRPCVIPESGLVCDLCWADPDEHNGFEESERGISFTFGADELKKFLERFSFDLLVRAHQVVDSGYEFFAEQQGVTLFSAPNYCNEFDNAAAIMTVDNNLVCSFEIMPPLDDDEAPFEPLTKLSCVYKMPVAAARPDTPPSKPSVMLSLTKLGKSSSKRRVPAQQSSTALVRHKSDAARTSKSSTGFNASSAAQNAAKSSLSQIRQSPSSPSPPASPTPSPSPPPSPVPAPPIGHSKPQAAATPKFGMIPPNALKQSV